MPAPDPEPARATPPALPPSPLERLNDFPDGLSPMLVKELRQGLRTHTFVILFLVLQGLLALVILTAGPIAAADNSASGATGGIVSKIVFCFYALGILVVQPMRGISAIATELKQNTIDLMVLTRLSAWRIVWGKWSSIMSQSALILLAIIPYIILRYFFGGMQLFAELALLLYIFLLSGALTAFTVGLSAVGSALIRGIVVVGGGATLMFLIPFHFTPRLETYTAALSFTNRDGVAALGLLALAVYGGYFFLELGATSIAPPSENRATRKRLVGLGVAVLSFLCLFPVDLDLALAAVLLVCALVSLDLFTERAEIPAVVCRPFVRWGLPGRLFGRFLYPGWATGTLFFGLLVLSVLGLLALTDHSEDHERPVLAAIAFGVMIFPAALIQLFARRSTQRFTIYITLSLMAVLLASILSMLLSATGEHSFLWAFSPIPLVQLPLALDLHSKSLPSSGTLAVLAWSSFGIYLLIVLAGAIPRLLELSRLEEQALQSEQSATEAQSTPDA